MELSENYVRRVAAAWVRFIACLLTAAVMVVALASAPAHAAAYQYQSGLRQNNFTKYNCCLFTMTGGYAESQGLSVEVKTVRSDYTTFARSSAYGDVLLSHAVRANSRSGCKWLSGSESPTATRSLYCQYNTP